MTEEVIEAGCLGCGAVQRQVLCDPCRVEYYFMRDWPFERIARYFVAAKATGAAVEA